MFTFLFEGTLKEKNDKTFLSFENKKEKSIFSFLFCRILFFLFSHLLGLKWEKNI